MKSLLVTSAAILVAALILPPAINAQPANPPAQGQRPPARPIDPAQLAPVVAASGAVFEAVSQFYSYDTGAPLNALSSGKRDFPTYTREKIVFTGINQSRVPGILALPKTGTGPYPVVILIDGVGGSKDRWFTEDSWPRGPLVSNQLLAAGIAVLALDARYHGERAAENDFKAPQFSARPADREMITQSIIEHRRAIDYLATRPEINSNRVGLLGLSMGGIMTFVLSSIDNRIKASVAGVTPIRPMKETIALPISPMVFGPAIKNVPFLMLMGKTDGFYSEQDAQSLFALIGSSKKGLTFYDSGHRLPPEYANRGVDWLKLHLLQ